MPAEVGNKIAGVIGAPSGTVSMHENVTTAHMIALSCVRPAGARKRIVCSAMDFPSMVYLYRAQQASGFELCVVPAEEDLAVRTDRMLDAIDESTAVVAFSHVLFRTSYIMDAAAIAQRARDVGATSLLDTYQSAGIIPVDVESLGVDFAVGGCLKWLCGGPGNAFLYTRPDLLAHAKPAFTGWLSRQHPFDFDIEGADLDVLVSDPLAAADPRTSRSDPTLRSDAMHMMNGTPSIPAYYAALAGLDIINAVGVDRIRDASKTMNRAAAGARRRVRLFVGGVARPRAARRHRRGRRARRPTRLPHPQSPRRDRRLPPAGGDPDLAALLQHDGGDRSGDGGDQVDRGDEELCRRHALEPRHLNVTDIASSGRTCRRASGHEARSTIVSPRATSAAFRRSPAPPSSTGRTRAGG